LRKQLSSLQSQRTAGVMVLQLLTLCQGLLERVRDFPTLQPGQQFLNRYLRGGIEQEIREQHRSDLLQVLAYSTVAESKRVVCCLAYPCRKDTWQSRKAKAVSPGFSAGRRWGFVRVKNIIKLIWLLLKHVQE